MLMSVMLMSVDAPVEVLQVVVELRQFPRVLAELLGLQVDARAQPRQLTLGVLPAGAVGEVAHRLVDTRVDDDLTACADGGVDSRVGRVVMVSKVRHRDLPAGSSMLLAT
jgi:hypothetical protein